VSNLTESIFGGGYMVSPADDRSNPVDLSVEAALQLEEFKQGIRNDVPALAELFSFIRTPAPAFEGESISLLADVRAYAIFRDSVSERTRRKSGNLSEFRQIFEQYLKELEQGVASRKSVEIDEAKRFCLSLNTQILVRQMSELYNRRERKDSRGLDHESIL